jgi:hypothetical protein
MGRVFPTHISHQNPFPNISASMKTATIPGIIGSAPHLVLAALRKPASVSINAPTVAAIFPESFDSFRQEKPRAPRRCRRLFHATPAFHPTSCTSL